MYCFFYLTIFEFYRLHNKHQNKFKHKNLYSITFSKKTLKKRANVRVLPVCTRVLLVCCLYVLVCTRMLLVCTRMYLYVTRMYSCVLVWCFSHDRFLHCVWCCCANQFFFSQIQFLCTNFFQTFARMNWWYFATNTKNSVVLRLMVWKFILRNSKYGVWIYFKFMQL